MFRRLLLPLRSRRGALGGLLALIATVALCAAAPQVARADPAPSVTVSVNRDGSLHVTWTKTANQDSYELLYDSASGSGGKLTPTAPLCNNSGNCCPMDTWCWPAQGVPLYCYAVLYHDVTGDCPGHEDLADSQVSVDTAPLKTGVTYYVQVMVADHCFSEMTCGSFQPEYWSSVVAILDHPSAGGGSGRGSGGSHTGGTAKVGFSRTVTITHADGTSEKTTGTVLVPGDLVRSFGNPTHLSLGNGTLVIDRDSQIAYTPAGTSDWTLKSGQVYYQAEGKYPPRLNGRFATIDPWGAGAAATITTAGAADVVHCYSGTMLVWTKGDSSYQRVLHAGQQVSVQAGKVIGTRKRFVPTRSFWK